MEKLVEEVLQNAKSLLDKVKAYEVQILAYTAQNKLREAVDTGLIILKLLGVSLPTKPSKLDILFGMVGTKLTLMGKRIESLIDLPEMTVPEKLAAMRILNKIAFVTYMVAPNLFPILTFKGVNLSIKHGNTSFSPVMYVSYGLILCGGLDIELGYRFGKLALNLLKKESSTDIEPPIIMFHYLFVDHWKEHLSKTLEAFQEGYKMALLTGNLECAAICAQAYCAHGYFIGKELAELAQEMETYNAAIRNLRQDSLLDSP
jgi:predicted ATPase